MDLSEKLEMKRRELGLTNDQFAERLGVSRAEWFRIKSRRRMPGATIRLGALQEFGISEADGHVASQVAARA